MRLEGFRGELFRYVSEYRENMLDAAADLRRRVGETRELGSVLTGELLARGVRVIHSIDVRNQSPLFPPLFLTFLEHREWIAPTDSVLVRIKQALTSTRPPTPTVYRAFLRYLSIQPMGGLFEMNVYDILDRAFPAASPQPRLPGSVKRSDLKINVDDVVIFVESTVLGEGMFWNGVESMMQAQGLSVFSTGGPGPQVDAQRILFKVAEELEQTATNAPNLLMLSFFGAFPSDLAREWAFRDLFNAAGRDSPRETVAFPDLSRLHRVDSIFEFGRARLREVHVNPSCAALFRLADSVRDKISAAFENVALMIR
jgi:hypothetical protein